MKKVTIVNSFLYANFNYCRLAWHFITCESIRKIEKIQESWLKLIVLDDYDSDNDVLLRKGGKVTMKIKRLRVLAMEILKTVNSLNPNYMKDIFTPKLHPKARPNDILIKHHNTITYGTKSLKILGPKIWNQLLSDIKLGTSYSTLYLTQSFPSSSFSAREYLSSSLRLNFITDMLLDFAQEKHKPENVLVQNFSALNNEKTPKLRWNGFFCNHFK